MRVVYQTLEDRNNPDDIECNGPFLCRRTDAWLGMGYYFWESFLNNAHWWGTHSYDGRYVICEAYYDENSEDCLDLVGNPDHINIVHEALNQMQQRDIPITEKTTLARVFEFLRRIGCFPFKATRLSVPKSKSVTSPFAERLPISNRFVLDLNPPIQICFYKKDVLSLQGYKIIYPEEYRTDTVC